MNDDNFKTVPTVVNDIIQNNSILKKVSPDEYYDLNQDLSDDAEVIVEVSEKGEELE